VQPATDCGMLNPGDIIHGTYSGTDTPDNHFRVLTMKVEPPGPAAGAATVPSTRTYYAPDFAPGAGASGSWTLNTAGMAPCGYVVRLEVWDRTIVSGNASGWKDVASVGFCLLAS